jgi:hypothetical protein
LERKLTAAERELKRAIGALEGFDLAGAVVAGAGIEPATYGL